MALYQMIDGEYVEITRRPYVKRNGVYVPVREAWVRQAGVYNRAFEFDQTPSSPPELSLQWIDTRYLKVGVTLPGGADSDLKRIRVLVSRKEMPSTQFGAGFIYEEDDNWQREPWSDWYYNDSNPDTRATDHGASNEWDYKQYPVNPTANTNLPGGQYYYVAAWSEDKNGNWSTGTFQKIWKPKEGNTAAKVINKEANFQANSAGSAGLNGAGYTDGDLIVRETPRSNGFWFHGNQFTSSIGDQGAPTVKSAKIRVTRKNDGGQPLANVRLFWHGKATTAEMPLLDGNQQETALLGTIAKGETKWFDIPESHYGNFNTDIKGFGLVYGIQASDYLEVAGLATDIRCGEVNVVWEEAL